MGYPILFLDRDGVINRDDGFVIKKDKFIFNPEIFEICKIAKDFGFKVVVVTNQSGIGRKKFTVEEFQKLTLWMLEEFIREDVRIEFVLASALSPELINPSNFELFRRKPEHGLFFDASEVLPIDFKDSIMIGDKISDAKAAYNAGIRKILLVGENDSTEVPFRPFKNLQELLNEFKSLVG